MRKYLSYYSRVWLKFWHFKYCSQICTILHFDIFLKWLLFHNVGDFVSVQRSFLSYFTQKQYEHNLLLLMLNFHHCGLITDHHHHTLEALVTHNFGGASKRKPYVTAQRPPLRISPSLFRHPPPCSHHLHPPCSHQLLPPPGSDRIPVPDPSRTFFQVPDPSRPENWKWLGTG